MPKILSFLLGTFFLALGGLGILIPGLPTTIFWIIAAGFYLKSSPKLYNRLMNHKKYGHIIRMYRDHRAISARGRMISLLSMWIMITFSSIIFFLNNLFIMTIILPVLGIIGTLMIFKLKVYRSEQDIILFKSSEISPEPPGKEAL